MRGSQFAELSAFAAVAESSNFGKAATHLGITAPTLSQSIRSLEERLGVRLFNRTTRSVALTEAGEHLLQHLLPALRGIDQAMETVNSFRDSPMGTLRLAVMRQAAIALVAPIVPHFLAEYPAIRLEIMADDMQGDIVSGHFDAGIRIGEQIEKDMIALRVFGDFRMLAVAAPSYLEKLAAPTNPGELHEHDCIRHRSAFDGAIHPWTFERDGEQVEIAVDGRLVVNDTQLVLSAAIDGIGVAYVPQGCAETFLASGRLVPLLEDWAVWRSGLFLYYPSRRQVPAPLRAFIDFTRRHLKNRATLRAPCETALLSA